MGKNYEKNTKKEVKIDEITKKKDIFQDFNKNSHRSSINLLCIACHPLYLYRGKARGRHDSCKFVYKIV